MLPGIALPAALPPRYNIAPSQPIAVVANNGQNRLEFLQWGLIPSWAKDPQIGNQMINARAESLAQKPSFRVAYRRRRCLIPADGFFEWRKEDGSRSKTPMYIHMKSGQPFAFAGLWEIWQQNGDTPLLSCTIITTAPNALLETIHNRMPVILRPEDYALWLDPEERTPQQLDGLLVPFAADQMEAYAVSTLVNSPRFDSPACIAPA
jgi:putative SOS response-associated peptidase YedK